MSNSELVEVDGVSCKKCGGAELKVTESLDSFGKPRRKAECGYCGTYIKFLPVVENSKEFIMPFGKHRGKALGDIDEDYLVWMLDNMKLRENMKKHVENVLVSKGLV